jgi:hypothetical protein
MASSVKRESETALKGAPQDGLHHFDDGDPAD